MGQKIYRNAVQCKKCGDMVESTPAHEFVTCSCGAVSVNGGHESLRRYGEPEDMLELSYWEPMSDGALEKLIQNELLAEAARIDKEVEVTDIPDMPPGTKETIWEKLQKQIAEYEANQK